jgi:MYXO-CTERM domain-containing protein
MIPTTGFNTYYTAIAAPSLSAPVSSGPIPVNLLAASTAFLLMNSVWGVPGAQAKVTFSYNTGPPDLFTLTAGTHFRDFNNDGYSNTTTSPNTQLAYGTSPGGAPNGQPLHRLDLLTFHLSPLPVVNSGFSVLDQRILTNIVIEDDGTGQIVNGVKTPGTSRIFVAGIIVETAAAAIPEPGPIALAAVAGLAGLAGYRRRCREVVNGWMSRNAKVG